MQSPVGVGLRSDGSTPPTQHHTMSPQARPSPAPTYYAGNNSESPTTDMKAHALNDCPELVL